jgi:hypothetical protein
MMMVAAENGDLFATCLRQLRDRLCWRKWVRTCGLAYTRPLSRDAEIHWLRANRADALLQMPSAQHHYSLDYVLPRLLTLRNDDRNDGNNNDPTAELGATTTVTANGLRPDFIRAALLRHYEQYLTWSDEQRFVFWYLESLRSLMGDVVVRDTADTQTAEMIDQYRSSYFRLTYTIDFTTQAIDDSSLWYFVSCIARYESHTTNFALGTVVNFNTEADLSREKERRWRQILRLTTMLNVTAAVDGLHLSSHGHTILDDMRLSFDILQKQPVDVLRKLTTNCGTGRGGNGQPDHVALSMIDVVDSFEWSIRWGEQRPPIYTRLAPVANAVQLSLKKYQQITDQFAGLEFDDKWQPIFGESGEDNSSTGSPGSTTVRVFCTNVMLDSRGLDASRRGHSFFLLHDRQPNLTSIFVRPDQDPSVPYVFDLFNESRCEEDGAEHSLRWVIAGLPKVAARGAKNSTSAAAIDVFSTSTLILLLHDIDNALADARFRVDNFLSNEIFTTATDTNKDEGDRGGYGALKQYNSEKLIGDGGDLWDVCETVATTGINAEKIVLCGKAVDGFYAPTDSTLFQHENHGLIPWGLGRPDLLHWKAYCAQPIDRINHFDLTNIGAVVQHKPRLYGIFNAAEAQRFLAEGGLLSQLTDVPLERVLRRPPFKMYKVVAKRVFALENGVVFVSTMPIKFLEKLPRIELDRLRMLGGDDNNRDLDPSPTPTSSTGKCPVLPVRRKYACFDRGDIYGSEIWFPRVVVRASRRCYRGVNKRIAPLVSWLDRLLLSR